MEGHLRCGHPRKSRKIVDNFEAETYSKIYLQLREFFTTKINF